MSAELLITSIIVYILSLVTALVLMMVSKKIGMRWRNTAIVFHFLLLLFFLLAELKFMGSVFFDKKHILFLALFCSGIAISGFILRSRYRVLMKIYFGLFLASVLFFVYSPSKLISFITLQESNQSANEFHLTGNYFLVKQLSLIGQPNEISKYKIVERRGMFNKTLERDISFNGLIDSARVIQSDSNQIIVRGYFNSADSLDIRSDLKINNPDEITIHRK
ncbi:MAG: hypothetical protein ACHQNT_04945 [Bacteroidia bacterium]